MKLPNLNKYKIKSKLKKIIFLKNYILTSVLIIGFSNFAHAIFRTRILNTDATFSIASGYPGNTPCSQYKSAQIRERISGNIIDTPAPYDSSNTTASSCFTYVDLATYGDVQGVLYMASSLGETATKLNKEIEIQKTKNTSIENSISSNAGALSKQLQEVIKDLVSNPDALGNNSQTSNERQALEALITAIVKKQLKASVKLNCQNTIGE